VCYVKIENPHNNLSMQPKSTAQELEILTIRKYFRKEKADRYAEFVLSPRTRSKFVGCLAHLRDLDFRKFRKLIKNEAYQIREMAGNAKFDTCYVISENKHIDGQFLNIENAIQDTIGSGMGTLLVFGLAEVVYYEGEDANDRWISI
jgi:hypothetical protein